MAKANNFSNSNNDLVMHKSSSSIEKLDDNFCGAFQEHYEYLMDKGLIETCQHSGTQLIQNEYENMSGNVSFKEFLHQYNQLKSWLDQLKSFNKDTTLSSYCEKYTKQIFYEEILKRSPRRELLNEYACHLVKYHPHLKHDVLTKLQYLNRLWRSIECSIMSKHYFNQDITKDLKEDLKNFELWLQEVESIVENLSIDGKWQLNEIELRLNEHIRLQNDIESHAKIINSVLKLSSKLKQIYVDFTKFYENGLCLQNRWHCLWIKSLEWQCRLEQEIARRKKVSNICDIETKGQSSKTVKYQEGNDEEDEPAKKSDTNNNENHHHHQQQQQQQRLEPEAQLNDKSQLVGRNTLLYQIQEGEIELDEEEEEQEEEEKRSVKSTSSCTTNDDIIPFDECEYEKIVCYSTSSTLANLAATNPRLVYIRLLSKSLNENLNRGRSFLLRRTMSTNDLSLFETSTPLELDMEPCKESINLKTSLTEPEIKNLSSQTGTRHHNHHNRFKRNKSNSSYLNRTSNDLSYYYSLTNVKYNAADDDYVEEPSKCASSSLSSISSSQSAKTTNKTSGSEEEMDESEQELEPEPEPEPEPEQEQEPTSTAHTYKIQKSITLPNANEILNFYQNHEVFNKTRSISSTDVSAVLEDSSSSVEASGSGNNSHVGQFYRCNHKSLSDYCMTSSRYILDRYRKHTTSKNHHYYYHRHGAMSKSMSVNNRRLYAAAEAGDEADCDDNVENSDEDAEELEYYYDNYNHLIEYEGGLNKVKNVVFHQYQTDGKIQHNARQENDIEMDDEDHDRATGHYCSSMKVKLNKLLLNNTTSAYDTCSNLSNEMSGAATSCSRSTTSNSSKHNMPNRNSSSSTSGNTSGDFNDDVHHHHFPHRIIKPTVINSESAIRSGRPFNHHSHRVIKTATTMTEEEMIDNYRKYRRNNQLRVIKSTNSVNSSLTGCGQTTEPVTTTHQLDSNTNNNNTTATIDETTHTDVSDPHWDGYTSSPYYSNSVTVEDICLMEKNEPSQQPQQQISHHQQQPVQNRLVEPILPWDEIFFELDPFDEVLSNTKENVKNENNNKKSHRFGKQSKNLIASQQQQLFQGPNNTTYNHHCSVGATPVSNHSHHHYYYHHYHHYIDNKHSSSGVNRLRSRTKPSILNTTTSNNIYPRLGKRLSSSETSLDEKSLNVNIYRHHRHHQPAASTDKSLYSKPYQNHHPTHHCHKCSINNEMEHVLTIINDSLRQLNKLSHMTYTTNSSTSTASSSSSSSSSSKQFTFTNTRININTNRLTFQNHIPKYNEILETCHTNISSLLLIKNSIIKHFKKQKVATIDGSGGSSGGELRTIDRLSTSRSTTSSSSLSSSGHKADNKIDYYLSKLDDTIDKWKMFKNQTSEEKHFDDSLTTLQSGLKQLRSALEFVNKCCKLDTPAEFGSLQALKDKSTQLEENGLYLIDLLKQLHELKNDYEVLSDYQGASGNHVDECEPLKSIGEELKSLEELQHNTSVALKVSGKKLNDLSDKWFSVDSQINQLAGRLNSKELESLIECASCAADSKQTRQGDEDTNDQKLGQLLNKYSLSDLDDIKSDLDEAELSLCTFKQALANLCPDDMAHVHNEYSLKLDKFKIQLRCLRRLLSERDARAKLQEEDNEPGTGTGISGNLLSAPVSHSTSKVEHTIDLTSRGLNYQHKHHYESSTSDLTSSTVEHPATCNDKNMLTNIHLDFQLDDTHDEPLTSTPRYRQIEIENTLHPHQGYGSCTKIRQHLTTSKSDDITSRSTQTDQSEAKKIKQGHSMDSGIILSGLLDHTNATNSSSESASPAKLSATTTTTKSLQHVNLFDDRPPVSVQKSESAEPIMVQYKQDTVRQRLVRVEDRPPVKEDYLIQEPQQVDEQLADVLADEMCPPPRERDLHFSPWRVFLYALMFTLLLGALFFCLKPYVLPSCCDFKKNFLIFNQQKNDENTIVPF